MFVSIPRLHRTLLRRPLNQLLLATFVIVALLPVGVLGYKLYQAAWDNAWREIHEKHRLLALNLASPIRIYLHDRQAILRILAARFQEDPGTLATARSAAQILKYTHKNTPDFYALILLNPDGTLIGSSTGEKPLNETAIELYARENCFLKTRQTASPQISGIKRSPLSGLPTIILSQPVYNKQSRLSAVLLAELKIDTIEVLRKNIHFGVKGHSAIVDQNGHVIAHPNPAWMEEMRDLSKLSIVRKMMARETGVTQFYSPFIKEDMVAGYTSVPGIGWGIMVPQPKSEVAAQVYRLLMVQTSWAGAGLLLAILLAFLLARIVTRPLNKLAYNARQLSRNNYQGQLPSLTVSAPLEIHQLDKSLHELLSGLIESREQYKELNASLQERIDAATRQLRDTNTQLETALLRADEFIGFARHDLRKPVAVINDVASTLKETLQITGKPPADLADLLELIEKSGSYMQDIITDFLGEITLHEDNVTFDPGQINLNILVHFIMTSNQAYARRKQIKLEMNLKKDLPEIYADDSRIIQVINNLVDNAIKFGTAGSTVTVVTRASGKEIVVEVKDNGPGLTDADLQKVFTKHARLSNKPTGGETSTGLGLVICKRIIELHHGSIGVNNNPEGGCTFWFRLPIRSAAVA
jgi:signal transduction histidine kinase